MSGRDWASALKPLREAELLRAASPTPGYSILACLNLPTHRVYVVQDNATRMQRNAAVIRGPFFARRARRKIERVMRPWSVV